MQLLEICRKQLIDTIPDDVLRKKIEEQKSTRVGLGGIVEEGTSTSEVRDVATGKLSDKGKELLKQGMLQFRPNDFKAEISFHDDPLYLPCCSYEYPMALRFFQRLTIVLNKKFELPSQNKYIRLKWDELYNEELKHNPNATFIEIVTNNFRFNLRFLASYRSLGFMGFVLLYLMGQWDVIPSGSLLQLIVIIFLIWIIYEGSFPTK